VTKQQQIKAYRNNKDASSRDHCCHGDSLANDIDRRARFPKPLQSSKFSLKLLLTMFVIAKENGYVERYISMMKQKRGSAKCTMKKYMHVPD
jgi:hypothetical protein